MSVPALSAEITLPLRSFDLEGQPSERLTLIDRGIAKAVVYDSQTAHRTGQKNTGHALPPNPFQPINRLTSLPTQSSSTRNGW